MAWGPFWCILIHFGAFWCTPCSTPWPLHDLLWLLWSFKCPFTLEINHISHSGQIRNTLLCQAMVTSLVHFVPFLCILMRLMCDPMTPQWLALTPILFQISIQSRIYSYLSLKTNLKHFALSWHEDHFGASWCILVHFGIPHVRPHDPSMTSSDSYPLPIVHLLQKWITLVIQDKFEIIGSDILRWPFWCILVHFCAFWCTSWVTPRPRCIEFSSGQQKYVSYASRAFKCDQPHLPSSGYTDLTWAISMG